MSRDDAAALLTELGTIERNITEAEQKLNDTVEQLKTAAAEKAKPLLERKKELIELLAAFYNENLATLGKSGTKIIDLAQAGTIRSKHTPTKIIVPSDAKGKRTLIARLRKLKWLQRFTKVGERVLVMDKLNTASDEELAKLGLVRSSSVMVYLHPSSLQLDIEHEGPRFAVRQDAVAAG